MFKKSLIALALAVAATGSFAQVYVQGALGTGTMKSTCAAGTTCKDSGSGNKLVIGYQAGTNLSYEGQIISYGKTTATAGANVAEEKGSGFGANVAYTANFNDNFGYRGALGLGINKVVASSNIGVSGSTNTTQLTAGFGVFYNISKTVKVTLDYDLSNGKVNLSNGNTDSGSMSLISIGIRASF